MAKSSSAEQLRAYRGPALFSYGFRPFFLAGSALAAAIPLLTALAMSGAAAFRPPGGIVSWHGHEMVYGYLGAVVAGFVLTAVPNWTGRLPIVGSRLIGLFALWFAGRVAVLFSGHIGAPIAALIDVAFPAALAFFLWREVIVGKNWRNVPVCILILLFALGNVLWHAGRIEGAAESFGLRWGAGIVLILLALVGGRITPSFTRNWIVKSGRKPIAASFARLDRFAMAVLGAAILAWLAAAESAVSGALLLLAGALHFVRLARWGGWRTFAEPLVAILHVGYLWLAAALTLLGLSILAPTTIAPTGALHAATAGAAGVMTLGVMTRATRGHTGRPLTADRLTSVIFALVNIGAALRVAAPHLPISYSDAVGLAGALWAGAFALFAVVYGRYLATPRAGPAA